MKVFIFATSEFDQQLLKQTSDFIKEKLEVSKAIQSFIHFVDPSGGFKLRHNFEDVDAFELCNKFRNSGRKIADDKTFVVCLTSQKHQNNWFSHFDYEKNNIFISTFGINNIIDELKEYLYIATELIDNIIHCISKLRIPEDINNNIIHLEPEGCVNDFCGVRNQIKLKMRAAFICPRCFDRLRNNTDPLSLMQLLAVKYSIRERMIEISQEIEHELPELKVTSTSIKIISGTNQITILDEARLMSLYILFLNHPEGLNLKEIFEKKNELYTIYEKICLDQRKTPLKSSKEESFEDQEFENRLKMNDTIDIFYSGNKNNAVTFENFKKGAHGSLTDWTSKIRKSIHKIITTPIQNQYSIELNKSTGKYNIKLDRSKVKFNFLIN